MLSRTRRGLTSRTTPTHGLSIADCSAEDCAAPPMWKVRMVSCVPGSPIDWAAMTPTASPMLTGRAARQVAAVAAAADAGLAVAGQHRAHAHAVDARLVDPPAQLLVEQRVARRQDLAGARMDDVLGHGPAQDALAQILAAARGRDRDRPLGAAILVDDDAVLRHIDQTPGEVARVRGLQARCRPDPCGRRASS